MAFSDEIKTGNIKENWLFELGFYNGDSNGNGEGGVSKVKQSNGALNLTSQNISDSSTTILIDDTSVFIVGDFIKINNEVLEVTGIASSTTLNVLRGVFDTNASSFLNNTQIYWNNFLPISFSDVTDNGRFYHGVILNKPLIRESLDLSKSISKTSNISISIPDFKYNNSLISETLWGGSTYFINQIVNIYCKVNNSDKVQIGSFRTQSINTDGNKLSISLTSHRPWDFISYPQNKHPEYGIYEPTVYGDFTPSANANTGNVAEASHCTLYPVPVLYYSSSKIYTLMPRAYQASDNAYIHYYAGFNQFVPLRLAEAIFDATGNRVDSITKSTIDGSSLNLLGSRIMESSGGTKYGSSFDGYITTAPSDKDLSSSLPLFNNQENMFKWSANNTLDTSLSSNAIFDNSSGESFYALVQTPKKNFHFEYIRGVLVKIKADKYPSGTVSADQFFLIDFFSNQFDSIEDDLLNPNITRGYDETIGSGTGASGTGTGIILFTEEARNSLGGINGVMCPDEMLLKYTSLVAVGRTDVTLKITSLQLHYIAGIPTYDGDGGSLSATELALEKDIETLGTNKYFYCGGNGLQHGINGLSGNNIQYIHEAHLDLLNRFAGLDVDTNPETDIIGWGNGSSDGLLDNAKDWKIRYWQLEPINLQEGLEKLQYEGGFIFRYKQGNIENPQYVFIKDSYSSTDFTLTKKDLKDINISPDSYNSLITKMNVNYQKNAKENTYAFFQESSNESARKSYNINEKENILEVDLDTYVFPEIPSSPSSNPNNDFYSYYNNIYGDLKLQIEATIVNPSFYNIDVGDTVDFSSMFPNKAFGKSLDNVVFMVTSLSRTLGILKFKAREISLIS